MKQAIRIFGNFLPVAVLFLLSLSACYRLLCSFCLVRNGFSAFVAISQLGCANVILTLDCALMVSVLSGSYGCSFIGILVLGCSFW